MTYFVIAAAVAFLLCLYAVAAFNDLGDDE